MEDVSKQMIYSDHDDLLMTYATRLVITLIYLPERKVISAKTSITLRQAIMALTPVKLESFISLLFSLKAIGFTSLSDLI